MRLLLTALLSVLACGGTDSAESAAPAPRPAARPAPARREPAPAMVGVEQVDAKGGLTPAQILEAVRTRKPDINACYEAALQKRPTLAGKVVVTWTITVDGRSENVALKSTTLGDPTAESCILAHVAKLVFPAPPNRIPAHVSFPFLFQPRGDR